MEHDVALDQSVSVRRIDFEDAELFIRADGDWRGFRSNACAKEPETAQWLRESIKPGDVFFDIGACVGSYSLIAASLGATVHAFEPMALNYSHLQQNIWLNKLDSIMPWPIALSSQTALTRFALSAPIAGAASHTQLENGETSVTDAHKTVTQTALAFTLDELVTRFELPQPAHIKIDVDGAEDMVAEGARETLRKTRSVMIETSKDTEAAVTAILTSAGLDHETSWPRSAGQSNRLFKRVY